jgi:capsular polysaccharide biosynthesis protein
MDLLKILNTVKRYWWLIVAITLLPSLTTFFFLKRQSVVYEAKARVLVGPNLSSPSPDLNALKIGGQLIQTYAEMVSSLPFLEAVNNKLDKKVDPVSLGENISAIQNIDTRILTIVVDIPDAAQAVAVANAATETLVEMGPSKDNTTGLVRAQLNNQAQELQQIVSDSEASIQQLDTQLLALGNPEQSNSNKVTAVPSQAPVNISTPFVGQQGTVPSQNILNQRDLILQQLAQEHTRLSDALRTLTVVYQVLLSEDTNQLEVIELAKVATPVNKNIPLKAAATGMAGFILAIGVVLALGFVDENSSSLKIKN